MAEYGHDELTAMFAQRGGMQSLGVLRGEAVMNNLNIRTAAEPVATEPAQPKSWLSLGINQ